MIFGLLIGRKSEWHDAHSRGSNSTIGIFSSTAYAYKGIQTYLPIFFYLVLSIFKKTKKNDYPITDFTENNW